MRNKMLYGVDTAIKSEVEEEKWLGLRHGMWYSILNITVSTYKIMRTIELEDFYHLEEELDAKTETLRGAFNMNFQSYEIVKLKSRYLIAGFLFSTIKNRYFRISGSHLNYVMLQGTTLALLTIIADVLVIYGESKRSLDHAIDITLNVNVTEVSDNPHYLIQVDISLPEADFLVKEISCLFRVECCLACSPRKQDLHYGCLPREAVHVRPI